MEISGFADLIILAIIAGLIALRLRSVLGRKDYNDKIITHKFRTPEEDDANKEKAARERDSAAPVLNFPKEPKKPGSGGFKPGGLKMPNLKTSNLSMPRPSLQPEPEPVIADPAVARQVEVIKKADRNFHIGQFLQGARAAFEMVLNAYANGDRATLKNLLDKELYESFEQAIAEREAAKQTQETALVGFESADIIHAELKRTRAFVTVRFVTEQINLIKDADGNVIEGDPSIPDTLDDTWVFWRDITSANPNWTVSDTGEGA